MTIIFDGTLGITSPGGDTSNTSHSTPIVKSPSSLVFQTNGSTEAMRITADGKVGIGETNLGNDKLVVTAAEARVKFLSSTGTNGVWTQYTNTAGSFYVGRDNSSGTAFGTSYASYLYSEGAYPLVTWINGLERMRIDSSGRVTMPYQSSFWAYLTASQTVSSGNQLIAFNATSWDVGNNFNTSTNRFTAPVTGKYLFAATVATGGGAATQNYFGVQFYLNGTQYVVGGWNRQEATGYIVDSKTTLLSLNAGDYVTVIVESQNGFNVNYTTKGSFFTGYLIG
jgi:hypothetical protein